MKKKFISILMTIMMLVVVMPGIAKNVDSAIAFRVVIDNNISDGVVTSDAGDYPEAGDTITLTVTPDVDYKLKELTVSKPKDIETIKDLTDLFGDATFGGNNNATLKVEAGNFVAYKDGNKIAELDSSTQLVKSNDYAFTATYEGDVWEFSAYGTGMNSIYLEDHFDGGITFYFFSGTNTGMLGAGEAIETTMVEEGKKYTFIMPEGSDVQVRATFELNNPKTYSISVDPTEVKLNAEEGYVSGTAEEGLKEGGINQTVKATSTGTGDVGLIAAGFKDSSSYENFRVIAGGLEATVYPLEGLKAGTYTATLRLEDIEDRFEAVEVPVTFTVSAKQESGTYKNTAGNNQSWTKGSNNNASFTFKHDTNDELTFDNFDKVLVDGKELSKDVDYVASKGSLIIDLKPSFLNKLSVGEHTLTTKFKDGNDVTSKFEIKENKVTPARSVPNTGVR